MVNPFEVDVVEESGGVTIWVHSPDASLDVQEVLGEPDEEMPDYLRYEGFTLADIPFS